MKIIEQIDAQKWREFVQVHPHGNIFQTPEMYDVFRRANNSRPVFLALCDDHNEILAVLLGQLQLFYKGLAGKLISRIVVLGGPLIKDEDVETGGALLKKYTEIAQKKAVYTQFRNLWDVRSYHESFGRSGYRYIKHLNILVDLTAGEEALWKGLDKARREGIRKARRNNLIFQASRSSDMIPAFYDLLKLTYERAKLPHPEIDFFYALHRSLPPANAQFFSISKENHVLAILLALIYKKCLYAYYIGRVMDEDYLRMKPIDLLYWEVLTWGVRNGCEVFDWLGAGKPHQEYGVRKFKLEFGGKLQEFGRYEKVHKPLLMKLGKLGLSVKQKIG